MYQDFYGLNRLPFQLLPDPDFFYLSPKHKNALTCLDFGVFERVGFIVITGEIGCGKTTLLRYLLRTLDKDLPIALISQTLLSPEDFLRTLCQEFSLPFKAETKSELLDLFGAFLVDQYQQGRHVILVLDEAQNFPIDTLEEIRMLSNLDADNERLLQIIMVGQPSLRSKLQREELRQLFQRVEVSYHLEPLDREELKQYIQFRLETAGADDPELFDEAAFDVIFECTGGIPRTINLICHRCCVYGFADNLKKITRGVVERVLKDPSAEGLFPQAQILSSKPTPQTDSKVYDLKEHSRAAVPSCHPDTSLNTPSAVSEISKRENEPAPARPVEMSGKAHRPTNESYPDESKFPLAVKIEVAEPEEDMAWLDKATSRIIDKEIVTNPVNPISRAIGQVQKLYRGYKRSEFHVKPVRRIVLMLILIFAAFLAGLAFWHPQKPDRDTQPPERETKVLKSDTPQTKSKADNFHLSQAQTDKPFPGQKLSSISTSDAGTNVSADQNGQADTNRGKRQITSSSIKTTPKNMDGAGSEVSKNIDATKYVCAVDLANVRAGPNTQAPILRRIDHGTVVEVIGKEGNWVKLKNKDGRSGWIFSDLLRRQD